MNYSTFERFCIGPSYWAPDAARPILQFLFAVSGAGSENRILLGFVVQGLVVEGYGVAFSMGQGLLRKLDFAKNGILKSITIFLENIHFLVGAF